MHKLNALLIDLDNTLYLYTPAHEAALDSVLGWIATQTDSSYEQLIQMYHEARHIINSNLSGTASSHNRLLYFQLVFERLGTPSCGMALYAYRQYWNVFLETAQLFPGVEDFFTELPIPVCVITDLTADIQHQKLEGFGLSRYVNILVTSEEAGHEKPSPVIFELALKKLGLAPENVIMVGDNYKKDILGAEHIGIRGILFNPDSTIKPECDCEQVNSFAELRRLLHASL